MYKQVDTSELTEQQKANLVVSHLSELAKIYRRRSDELRDAGEPIFDLIQVALDKESDVEKLKSWTSIILNQHVNRTMGEALNLTAGQPVAPRRTGFDMVMGAEALVGLLGKAKVEAERLMGSFRETRNTVMVEHAREIETGLDTVLFILQRLTYPRAR